MKNCLKYLLKNDDKKKLQNLAFNLKVVVVLSQRHALLSTVEKPGKSGLVPAVQQDFFVRGISQHLCLCKTYPYVDLC